MEKRTPQTHKKLEICAILTVLGVAAVAVPTILSIPAAKGFLEVAKTAGLGLGAISILAGIFFLGTKKMRAQK